MYILRYQQGYRKLCSSFYCIGEIISNEGKRATMNLQSPVEDRQQTENSQQVLNQKQHSNPRHWYRSRTRTVKVSLVCGTLIVLLLFGLFVAAVSFYGNRASTRSGSQQAHTLAQNSTQDPISAVMPQLTPPPAQTIIPIAHATTKPSSSSPLGNGTQPNVNSASPASVYFGVHMPLTDMSLVLCQAKTDK